MATEPEDRVAPRRYEMLRRAEQPIVGLMVAAGVFSIGAYWTMRYLNRDRLIEIDQAAPFSAEFKVDINTAAWPELVVLPEVGEAMAREIVAERERGGPFVELEDVAHRVRGAGPQLLKKIAPYVLPIRSTSPVAADAER